MCSLTSTNFGGDSCRQTTMFVLSSMIRLRLDNSSTNRIWSVSCSCNSDGEGTTTLSKSIPISLGDLLDDGLDSAREPSHAQPESQCFFAFIGDFAARKTFFCPGMGLLVWLLSDDATMPTKQSLILISWLWLFCGLWKAGEGRPARLRKGLFPDYFMAMYCSKTRLRYWGVLMNGIRNLQSSASPQQSQKLAKNVVC